MTFTISNVRLKGFATNSSSSHSVILAGSCTTPMNGPSEDNEFGWEHFLQSTSDEKVAYLAQALYDSLIPHDASTEDQVRATNTVKRLLGVLCTSDGCIDHQSHINIPDRMNGKLAIDFWAELTKSMSSDPTVEIAGGNDNGGEVEAEAHPFWHEIHWRLTHYAGSYRVRKDGEVWTLFDANSGAKLHVSFANREVVKDFKPAKPELVDLKITNRCTSGCNFCYQNSVPNGKHAKFSELYELIQESAKKEVFEIAIGGGEPTLHPQFKKIIRTIRSCHIVPNFSTKNYKFFTSENIGFLKEQIGSVGISVSNVADAKAYMQIIKDSRWGNFSNSFSRSPILMHYVLDQYPLSNFIKILEVLAKEKGTWHHLLLLGNKVGGRNLVSHFDNTGFSLFLMKHLGDMNYDVSVDTLIANRYEDDLKSVNHALYYKEEGRFSLYIDAVDHKFGKASYATALKPYKNIGSIFKEFKVWKPEILGLS